MGTCVHSHDTFSLYVWLDHVNWMRIIGLKREELPYYCYEPDQDYIIPLAQRANYSVYTTDLFVIQKQNYVANPRSHLVINKITGLYDTPI